MGVNIMLDGVKLKVYYYDGIERILDMTFERTRIELTRKTESNEWGKSPEGD